MNHLWLEFLIPGSKLCHTRKKTASQLPDCSLFLHFYKPCIGLEHLVAAKDQQVGFTLEGFSHLPCSPPKTKGFWSQMCWLCVTEEHRWYPFHFVLLQGREKNGIWVPALWAKCHEETLRSNTGMLWFNLLRETKWIWLSLSSKAFFIARNAVSFGSTLVLLSGKRLQK